ncbi:MAG: apolipoprotein N-acyltransferase [Armatimonadota bacterium]
MTGLARAADAPAGKNEQTAGRRGWAALRRTAQLGCAALSALLLNLACPPYDLAWLAWPALVPLFLALLRFGAPEEPGTRGARAARMPFALGFTWGFVFLLLHVPWFAGFSPAGYPVAAAYWGVLGGLVCLAAVTIQRAAPLRWTPMVFASAWVLFEWLRAQGTLAFPWGTLSVTQYRALPLLQMLDLTGSYGLSFLMALTAAGAACAALYPGNAPVRKLRVVGAGWAGVALLLVAGGVVRGNSILAQPTNTEGSARVAVIQASHSVKSSGVEVVTVSPPGEYAARTREAIRAGADLVVWPESASQEDGVNDPYVRQHLAGLVAGTETHLLAGSFIEDLPSGMLTNAAAMFAPTGEVTGQYAKVLIVPFGEYLPLRPLLSWTERLGMPPNDLRAGTGWNPVPWSGGAVGISICFESAFGYVSREMVNRGANLLAVLTSDGWAGRSAAGLQHAAFAPLRAVETRRSVARAAATGVSQLLDPHGRPLESIPMFTKGFAVAELPLRTDLTLYARLGDWPVLLAAACLALLAISARRQSARGAVRH